MATERKDEWSPEEYHKSASLVSKSVGKVLQWLNVQKDDVILDIGCGDGVHNLKLAKIVARGFGHIHGIDSSPAMIAGAKDAAASARLSHKCTFEVLDATTLLSTPSLQRGLFTKAFSSAALHWILTPPETREAVFHGIRAALVPRGTFVFEMGGFGNGFEFRTALLSVLARRVGMARAREADPWFFPDEEWAREFMEVTVGGWSVVKAEREWVLMPFEVEGWVRLLGQRWFEIVPEEEREECIREVVELLEVVCRNPRGGYEISWVRLRVVARKV